jgi:hypothetical protein
MRGPAGSVCPHCAFHGISCVGLECNVPAKWGITVDDISFNMRQPDRCDVAAVGVKGAGDAERTSEVL